MIRLNDNQTASEDSVNYSSNDEIETVPLIDEYQNVITPENTYVSSYSDDNEQVKPVDTEHSYAVNNLNGMIHIVDGCFATQGGKRAMDEPIYFYTYEEAETYSINKFPVVDHRNCHNCWK